MLIHFAFARLKDNPDEQIDALINKILNKKRLKFSRNPEFIPVFKPHIHPRFKGQEVHHIALESFKDAKKGAKANLNDLKFIKHESDIHFLSNEVRMICFIKIAFKQAKNSPHSQEYGKLGLVFDEKFLKRNGIKPVQYYKEESLYNNSLVLEWNLKYAYRPNLSPKEIKNKEALGAKILAYRKPSILFKSFIESRMLAIKRTISETKLKIIDAYERYPIGYNFQTEKEWRIVSNDSSYLEFSENELYMIIVPNLRSKLSLKEYFKSDWKIKPEILTFP